MWLLGRSLPLMVGQNVPEDDEQWACFLNLLRIVTIATAVEVTLDDVAMLSFLIEEYVLQFNSLYHDCVTPKIHYLLHLAEQIRR